MPCENHGMNIPNTLSDSLRLAVPAKDAATLCSLSRSHWWRLHTAGKVPLPVYLGNKAPRWRVDELRDWLTAGAPDRQTWQRMRKGQRMTSPSNAVHLDFDQLSNRKVKVTARRGGAPVYIDTFDPSTATARRQFIKALVEKVPSAVCELVAWFIDLPRDTAAGTTATLALWALLRGIPWRFLWRSTFEALHFLKSLFQPAPARPTLEAALPPQADRRRRESVRNRFHA